MSKIKNFLLKFKKALEVESIETRKMLNIYTKASFGEASQEEIKEANDQMQNLLKSVGLGALLIIPFSPVTIFLLMKLSQRFEIDLFPSWYKNQALPNIWDSYAEDYSGKVFSLSKSERILEKISQQVKGKKVLILGCGSEIYLQKYLLEKHPDITVIASDFSQNMIKIAESKYQHERLTYKIIDMTHFEEKADTIISVNSLLLPRKKDNEKAWSEISKNLNENGRFIAYLVSFNLSRELESKGVELILNIKEQAVQDTSGWQSFHTLESILENVKKNKLTKVFLEKDYFQKIEKEEMRKIYGLSDEYLNLCYEYFFVGEQQ